MAKKTDLPSTLAFSRGIEPTEGVMGAIKAKENFSGIADIFSGASTFEQTVVEITTTTVRGTIANYDVNSAASRVGSASKAINAANIAKVERALLPADADKLLIQCQLRFNESGTKPTMNNSAAFAGHIADFVKAYASKGGYDELAARYFIRAAAGSWAWRNRVGEKIEVRLELDGDSIIFAEGDVDLSSAEYSLSSIAQEKQAAASAMIQKIGQALSGQTGAVTLKCAVLITMGFGAEVYPSQEFGSEATLSVDDKSGDKPTKVLSKVYDMRRRPVATIHARKIGNAIRTIDTWHGVAGVGAIAVEMFGANTQQSVAHRINSDDFYTYFKDVDVLAAQALNGLDARHHYVAACLIRGGVFGFGSK